MPKSMLELLSEDSFFKDAEERIDGGKADDHPDSDYPKDQLEKGTKVEKEHTDSEAEAKEIAKDHLEEEKELNPDKNKDDLEYYDELDNMEEGLKKKAFEGGFLKAAKELTARGRKQISESNFVFPKERRYPIHDASHARNALARVSQHGTPAEQEAVRKAVKAKYPGIGD